MAAAGAVASAVPGAPGLIRRVVSDDGRVFWRNPQVSQREALLVAVVLFPAAKVSDVALAPQQTRPSFRGLHHGVVYAHRKDNDLSVIPGSKVSSTMRTFAGAVQRRRC
jgi:hypothetical protein